MSRTFTISTKPYEDCTLYSRKNFTINPGLTILIGCNGAGKTTMLNHIKYELEKNEIPVFQYDNVHDGGSKAMAKAGFYDRINTLANLLCSSEGEQISQNIGQAARQIGCFVKNNVNKDEIWILFDAIDSGYSIDNIIETKTDLFNTIIDDCKNRNLKVYIVVSANSYEMAHGEQCLDIWNGKYITFKNYDEYKEYILKTRARKDKRDYARI